MKMSNSFLSQNWNTWHCTAKEIGVAAKRCNSHFMAWSAIWNEWNINIKLSGEKWHNRLVRIILRSVMIVFHDFMPSAGVDPLCVSSPNSTQEFTRKLREHVMLLSVYKLRGDVPFFKIIFKQDLVSAHSSKTANTCFTDHVTGQKTHLISVPWRINMNNINRSIKTYQFFFIQAHE